MTSSRKCSQMIARTTNYGTQYYSIVFSYAVPVYMYLCNHRKCENDIFLVCHSDKCDHRRKGKAWILPLCYVSIWVYFIVRYLHCSQSYKYIRFGRPYYYFRLLVVVRIIRGTFFEIATVENLTFCRLNEFQRYLSKCQGYKYFQFGRPYCYVCSWHIDNDMIWYDGLY